MSVSYELLKEDKRVIAYRPRLSRMIGTTAAILLQQIIYWYNHEPFYKFKTRCHNEKYKEGDSWTEELGFSTSEFDTAIKRIGTKVKKGVKKSELIDGDFDIPQPLLTETKRQYTKRLHNVLNKLVIYWIDSNRVTWYHLNTDLLGKLINSIYLDKLDISIYLENAHAQFTFMQETTHKTTTKEKDLPQQVCGDTSKHICNVCNKPIDADGWITDGMEELAICGKCYAGQDVHEDYIVGEIADGKRTPNDGWQPKGKMTYGGYIDDSTATNDDMDSIVGNCGDVFERGESCIAYDDKAPGCVSCMYNPNLYIRATSTVGGTLRCTNPDCGGLIEYGGTYYHDGRGSVSPKLLCPGCYTARNDCEPQIPWNAAILNLDEVEVDCLRCDGKCIIDDVEDTTICLSCSTVFDVQRNCAIVDGSPRHEQVCDSCEIKGTCKLRDGVELHEQNSVADLEATPTMAQVDAAIYGTRDKPVVADEHIGALCEVTVEDVEPPQQYKKATPRKPIGDSVDDDLIDEPTPKQTPEQKQAKTNIWEAVKFAWELNDNAAWKLAKLQQFFMGTIKKTGKYKDFFDVQLDIPANALEVVAFGHWYKTEYDNVSMPESGAKLRSHFETFRGSGERYQTFMRKAITTVTGKIPKIVMEGINDTPEEVEPEEEETITDEQKAEVFKMMKALEDKFSSRGAR
jgi:hypothetical protein